MVLCGKFGIGGGIGVQGCCGEVAMWGAFGGAVRGLGGGDDPGVGGGAGVGTTGYYRGRLYYEP